MADPHWMDETVNWPTRTGLAGEGTRSVMMNGKAAASRA